MNRPLMFVIVPALLLVTLSSWAVAADTVMGNWSGAWRNENADADQGKLEAQVIALGQESYEAIFLAFYDDKQSAYPVKLEGQRREGKVTFGGKVDLGADHGGVFEWSGEVAQEKFTGRYTSKRDRGSFTLTKVSKKSPTLEKKPPRGAVVLFDGKNLNAWKRRGGDEPAGWKIVDGAAEVVARSGDIVSRESFGDHELHLEFRTPFMPEARGQGRGNSGVYLQGRYEIQVLDSFGLKGLDNECGGIYSQHAPKTNACLPPEEWQTYDITFHAARRDDAGKIVKKARLSVIHNGITIHDNVELKGLTGGALDEIEGTPGPLLLQDHGNPVQFRNIWVLPLEIDVGQD